MMKVLSNKVHAIINLCYEHAGQIFITNDGIDGNNIMSVYIHVYIQDNSIYNFSVLA